MALDMRDRSGLDALAMRRPADVMDMWAGTPYRHFTAKRDLRTARSEHMTGRLAEAAAMAGGRAGSGVGSERPAARARAPRAALLARRDGLRPPLRVRTRPAHRRTEGTALTARRKHTRANFLLRQRGDNSR
ncbi:hypothetical protein TPA0910_85310 [Streptomyces hygroscopicus subsp. sporocinereus]|uniref:Uncharacterized protein n=1 Tax=Streptomyces hygroscopicus TaxID=1912 RepID=A0ABQ3UER0_STRHY|nr:hypothetical protein TPA0910_85310 [Streptomyces hygroscopicus]